MVPEASCLPSCVKYLVNKTSNFIAACCYYVVDSPEKVESNVANNVVSFPFYLTGQNGKAFGINNIDI